MSSASRRARHAFTLVELLVVIGIIAVLISILLPSLSRARQQANMVSCLSNLRQIGQTLQLYCNDNKGFLPYGRGPNNLNTRPYITNWTHEVTTILGKDVGTAAGKEGTQLAPVVRCPETFLPSGLGDDNYKFHYAVNPRLMPDFADSDPSAAITPVYPDTSHSMNRLPVRRQLATVEAGTEKFLVWDGAQVPVDTGSNPATTNAEGNNNASIYSGGLDGDAWNVVSHKFCDPSDDPNTNLDTKIGVASTIAYNGTTDVSKTTNVQANLDAGTCFMRFRHIGNTQMGVLFCDGHAEQRTIGAVTRREVCVNWK